MSLRCSCSAPPAMLRGLLLGHLVLETLDLPIHLILAALVGLEVRPALLLFFEPFLPLLLGVLDPLRLALLLGDDGLVVGV
eukprot:10671363-Alexandrium_andersonii.AAC.1